MKRTNGSGTRSQPRWGLLYLLLPLTLGLLWLAGRVNASRPVAAALSAGIILLIGAVSELWHRTNRTALLHSPRGMRTGESIYSAREVLTRYPALPADVAGATDLDAVPQGELYGALFRASVTTRDDA